MARTVETAILRALMRIWLLTAEMSKRDLPRPPEIGAIRVDGPRPRRVLLLGNGAAVGYGVLSHDLALAGHLARQLSALSRCGTRLRVVADGSLTAATALDALGTEDLTAIDAVVITIGMNETLTFAPEWRWQRDLTVLFETIERMPGSPCAFMVAIPPLDSVTRFPPLLGAAADRHASRLNRRLGELCTRFAHVHLLPFSPTAGVETRRYRSSDTYRDWAALIATPIAEALRADGDAIRAVDDGVAGPML